MSRNRSRIGLCGQKSVHDHGDGISYFVTQDSIDLFSSRLTDMDIVLGVKLTWGQLLCVIVGYEGYISWICLMKTLMYFVHINHNPMNSNPNGATSRWDPLIKTTRIVIILFFSPKMRSLLVVNNIGVMFSIHGDSR